MQENENLGRLDTTIAFPTVDPATQLFSYGARSFSIFDAAGNLVYDSGDDFEQITAAALPDQFNFSNDDHDPDEFESRSDAKGPEPEAVEIAEVYSKTYAFIGLERIGGIMVYDITTPNNPRFVQYVNNRDFTAAADSSAAGDLGPEGLRFIAPEDSPNGEPLLVVANEVSGTTTIFQIDGPGRSR